MTSLIELQKRLSEEGRTPLEALLEEEGLRLAVIERIAWLEQRLENLANTPADWVRSNFREYARYTLETAHETTHASEKDQ